MESAGKKMLEKVVFLDRDGVINRDSPDYIKSCEEFEFLPGSQEGIRLLSESGFHVIIITNQSIIGRKMISRGELDLIFEKLESGVEKTGGKITDIFFCPHVPGEGCACRKPLPGMILTASEKHCIDLASSVMVGDSVKDIECARNAGCGKAVLVRTGNGAVSEETLFRGSIFADHVADDLLAAARWIIGE